MSCNMNQYFTWDIAYTGNDSYPLRQIANWDSPTTQFADKFTSFKIFLKYSLFTDSII